MTFGSFRRKILKCEKYIVTTSDTFGYERRQKYSAKNDITFGAVRKLPKKLSGANGPDWPILGAADTKCNPKSDKNQQYFGPVELKKQGFRNN